MSRGLLDPGPDLANCSLIPDICRPGLRLAHRCGHRDLGARRTSASCPRTRSPIVIARSESPAKSPAFGHACRPRLSRMAEVRTLRRGIMSSGGSSSRAAEHPPSLAGQVGAAESGSRGSNWGQVRTVRQESSWRMATRTCPDGRPGRRSPRSRGCGRGAAVRLSVSRSAASASSGATPNRSTNRSRACRVSRTADVVALAGPGHRGPMPVLGSDDGSARTRSGLHPGTISTIRAAADLAGRGPLDAPLHPGLDVRVGHGGGVVAEDVVEDPPLAVGSPRSPASSLPVPLGCFGSE